MIIWIVHSNPTKKYIDEQDIQDGVQLSDNKTFCIANNKSRNVQNPNRIDGIMSRYATVRFSTVRFDQSETNNYCRLSSLIQVVLGRGGVVICAFAFESDDTGFIPSAANIPLSRV